MRSKVKTAVILVVALAALGIFVHGQGLPTESQLDENYHRLARLSYKITTKGTVEADEKESRRIRDYFVSTGDPGGRFLIQKLQQIIAEELDFLKGRQGDTTAIVAYAEHLRERGKTPLLKYDVCWILADAFPKLSADLQQATLKAIVSSYTPSTYFREDIGGLNHALIRTGPQAVPYLLELASHRNELARCSVSDVLNSLGQELIASGKARAENRDPPHLDCHASPEQRQSALRDWGRWWQDCGKQLTFPVIPSFFDLDGSGEERPR